MRKGIMMLAILMFASIAPPIAPIGQAGQVPLTDSCDLITPSGTVTGYTLQVARQNGEFPFFDSTNNSYRYAYVTTLPFSNSSIAFKIPNCSDPGFGLAQNEFSISIFPPGSPTSDISGKTNFGLWTDYESILKISNYNANVGPFAINTSGKNTVRQTSIQIKAGNDFYFCPGIRAMGCPEEFAQSAVVAVKEVITKDGFHLCVKTDPSNQCDTLVDCATGEEFPSYPEDGLVVGSSTIQYSSTPGSGCVTFIIRTEGPNTFYYFSNGRYYRCDVVNGRTVCY